MLCNGGPYKANSKEHFKTVSTRITLNCIAYEHSISKVLLVDVLSINLALSSFIYCVFAARKAKVNQTTTVKPPNQNFHIPTSFNNQSSQGSQAKSGYYGDSHQQGNPFNRANRK